MQKSLSGLLRSILYQILTQFTGLATEIIPMHVMQNEKLEPGITRFMKWSEENLQDALSTFYTTALYLLEHNKYEEAGHAFFCLSLLCPQMAIFWQGLARSEIGAKSA